MVAVVVLLGITIVVAPAQLDRLSGLRSSLRAQTTIERDLEATAHAARRFGRCRPIAVEGHRQVPVIARELDVRAASVRLYRPTARTGALAAPIVARTESWLPIRRC